MKTFILFMRDCKKSTRFWWNHELTQTEWRYDFVITHFFKYIK